MLERTNLVRIPRISTQQLHYSDRPEASVGERAHLGLDWGTAPRQKFKSKERFRAKDVLFNST
jgi:hypothetical protein